MTRWPGNAKDEQTSFGALSRSELMARVRSVGNKTTELKMRGLLKAAGINGWRRHVSIFGKPDFAWPKDRVALFIDGCFWHGHSCGKNINPTKNAELWGQKLAGNRARDRGVTRKLTASGWSVVRIWECWLKQHPERCLKKPTKKLHASDRRGVGAPSTPDSRF